MWAAQTNNVLYCVSDKASHFVSADSYHPLTATGISKNQIQSPAALAEYNFVLVFTALVRGGKM